MRHFCGEFWQETKISQRAGLPSGGRIGSHMLNKMHKTIHALLLTQLQSNATGKVMLCPLFLSRPVFKASTRSLGGPLLVCNTKRPKQATKILAVSHRSLSLRFAGLCLPSPNNNFIDLFQSSHASIKDSLGQKRKQMWSLASDMSLELCFEPKFPPPQRSHGKRVQ